jgi:hypothetical protein
MADRDGKYGFEVGAKQVVAELYTVDGHLYYDVFVNGELLAKQGSAQPGEDHDAVIQRLHGIISSGA